jgi:hypothetical protein
VTWLRRPAPAEMPPEMPPENVRLVIGGQEYPCDVLRDPDQDENGCAAWVAVPREPPPVIAAGFEVLAGMLPAKSRLLIELDLGKADGR